MLPQTELPMILLHVLVALLVNAIPAWGVWAWGWSIGVLLILFWWENLVGVLLQALRIQRHQRDSGDKTYSDRTLRPKMIVDGRERSCANHAQGYLATALPFALGHGAFAIVLPLLLADETSARAAMWYPEPRALAIGAALVTATLLFDLLLDLRGLARRSYASVKQAADARFVRVCVLHVVIILGVIAARGFDSAYGMLAVMIGLKTLVDVGAALAGRRA